MPVFSFEEDPLKYVHNINIVRVELYHSQTIHEIILKYSSMMALKTFVLVNEICVIIMFGKIVN